MSKEIGITALGEVLIDFTSQGKNDEGQVLFSQNPGGAPANVLVAAQRLGAQTAFIGKVGTDMHGQFLKQTLEKEDIDTKGLIEDSKYFTTLAFVNINKDGERNFSFARKPGADTKLKPEEVDISIINNTKILHVGSLSLTNEPSRSATFYALQNAKNSIISYDPNYRASLWRNENIAKKHMRSVIPFVDFMKLSDEETQLLTGEKDVEKAARILLNQGVKAVAVTLGKNGAYICNKEGGRYIKPQVSKIIRDTNGAGDSFWGGFLYKIQETNKKDFSLEELVSFAAFANAVASICIERKGAIPAMPYLNEVEERLKN